MKKSFFIWTTCAATLALAAARAADAPVAAPQTSQPTSKGAAEAVEIEGVHNAFRIGRKIISGSCPHGEAGFAALAKLGVQTILSVDGARPDLALATKYKMRYVHVPVPYSGISRAQSLAIARAVRDLPGPVFIHCHHGKHRGPTAAVLAAMLADGWTNEQAQSAMSQAGTAKTYAGLWGAVRDSKPATQAELDKADDSFPALVQAAALPAAMVVIDQRWEALGEAQKAGWEVPRENPDLDPSHEALMLGEEYAELLRSPETAKHPEPFRRMMSESRNNVAALEAALRARDKIKADAALKLVTQDCKSCHVAYRDTAEK